MRYWINIPFYSLAWQRPGLPFIVKSKNKALLSNESHFPPLQKTSKSLTKIFSVVVHLRIQMHPRKGIHMLSIW